MSQDPYQVLGIERAASSADIKAAYRRLAMEFHPDRNRDNPGAEERFKDVAVAYALLGDEAKRAEFDRFGAVAARGPLGGETTIGLATDFFESVFGDLFGVGRKRATGQDLRYTLEVSFEDAASGCERTIKFSRPEDCRICAGTGATEGVSGLRPCERCEGAGVIRAGKGVFAARRDCQACGGSGEVPRIRCQGCSGTGLVKRDREFMVRIPPRSHAGAVQRVQSEGAPGRRGGPSGDLFVTVRVLPSPVYRDETGILILDLPVTVSEAALGAEVEVPLLEGVVRMRIPAGTQSGAVFRLRERGLPRGSDQPRGDAHINIVVETPVRLTDEMKVLLTNLAAAIDTSSLPRKQALDVLIAARKGSV